ncbi:transporter [Candidatus Thiodiazotropha endoloripes]|uniref:efflux RND transporter permease subunit n=1 Tax=Candidatus Thiodiazotropha endoloripes TaxID=1818881 RepID=UPI00083DA4FF|nr:MMPL family transporter [Candidatus Thiodiazotropha endoloripes]MCG7901978.1 MMPL family transporter [Candidatus Thiodiazotropha weberae]ODB83901.1 transporter [Candidatus Thiodiazotropha endoloripes]ODB90505.1 transporter [Candidatus Thiodiazotropha endoloripes]
MSGSTAKQQTNNAWAEGYADFVIKYRWPLMMILLVVTILAALQIKNLDMRNDPDTLLPPSNRYVATNLYAEHNFGMGNLMVFTLRINEGDVYKNWFVNKVQEIHNRLVDLPTARESNFIDVAAKKIKYMGADENGLVFKRLIPTEGISSDPEKAAQQLAFLKEGIENNPVIGPMLIGFEDAEGNKCEFSQKDEKNCTAKSLYIIGDYTDEVKEIYLPWVREIRAMMDEYSEDDRFEVLVAGEPYFLAWMLADLVNKWWLFVISFAIVIAALWFEFRNWRGSLFPIIGVSATIILTLGLMGFSAFKLTTMMVLTPMLLLAIGIGHSVQVTRRFMQEQAKSGDCESAARSAISHTIVPATLSIVTDMVGFATLATVDISFYKAYAYFGMFGMLTLLFTTTTLIPLLMMTFPCSHRETKEGHEHEWETKVGSFISGLLTGPGKLIPIGIVMAIMAWSVYETDILNGTSEDLMPGVEKGINYSRAAFKEKSITIQHIERLNEIMPGVISVSIPIRGKEPTSELCVETYFPEEIYDIEDPQEKLAQCEKAKQELNCWDPDPCGAQGIFNEADVLADIEALEEWMRSHEHIGFTGSYAQYIRLVNMLLTAEPGEQPDIKDLYIPTSKKLREIDPDDDRGGDDIVQLYNGLLETMTEEGDMDSFVMKNWNEGVVMGFINTMDPVETHNVTMDIQEYIEDHKNDPGFSKVNFGLRSGPVDDLSGDTNELSVDGSGYVRPGLGGFLGATEATREVAVDNWLSGPLLTAAAVFVIAALIFRSLVVSVILMVLLFITLFAQYGLGGYMTSIQNWSGNLAFHLQVALSIAMGLGIDYGIYMMSRLKEEMQATAGNWQEALVNTLNTTGSAVIISVVVLLGCFIPLLNTDLANTWGLGIYISQALLIDVVTALTILPMLVAWLKPRFVFGEYKN